MFDGVRSTRASADLGPLPHVARPATIRDWLAIPEERRAELIDGRIVYHAFPGPKHGHSQRRLGVQLDPYTRRSVTARGGGPRDEERWWISLEVDMEIGGIGCRPDLIGWRCSSRTRAPEPNDLGLVTDVPDFICEVLSESTARYDLGEKREAYFRAGVAHYWLIDPNNKTFTVLKRTARGYVVHCTGGPGDSIYAEPFDRAPIVVADFFLDEDDGAVAPPAELAATPAKKMRASTSSKRRAARSR